MKDIKFRYVYKHVVSSNGYRFMYFTLDEIESNSFYEDCIKQMERLGFNLISRDLCIKIGDLEIYENDKVKVEDYYVGDSQCKGFIGTVIMNGEEGLDAIIIGDNDFITIFDWYHNSDKKVTGNIYE